MWLDERVAAMAIDDNAEAGRTASQTADEVAQLKRGAARDRMGTSATQLRTNSCDVRRMVAGHPVGGLSPATAPSWWLPTSIGAAAQETTIASAHPGDPFGFLRLLQPYLQQAQEAAQAQIQRELGKGRLAGIRLAEAIELASKGARRRLYELTLRCLLVDLAQAREAGNLVGETPEERFSDFVATPSSDEARHAFSRRYPLVWRAVGAALTDLTNATVELLTRLARDLTEIRRVFAPGWGSTLSLAAVSEPLGDTHDGREVVSLGFSNGLRIVYKPRALAAEAAYYRLAQFLNSRGLNPTLRVPTLLERADYGWMEFVEPAECVDEPALQRYFHRLGSWTAVLLALQTTDMHHENLIAVGEYPIFIDLESACQPMGRFAGEQFDSDLTAETAIRTGLFPRRIGGHGEDLCGLATRDRAATEVSGFVDAGQDTMRIARKPAATRPLPNLPSLAGCRISAYRGRESVLDGFRQAYRLLTRTRNELLAPGGPLSALKTVPCRYIFRPTLVYFSLREAAAHPTVARDALAMEEMLDRLWRHVSSIAGIDAIVAFEQACLRRGNIPRLMHLPGSADLMLGEHRVEDFFLESGIARFGARLQAMGEEDLQRQCHALSLGLAAARAEDEGLGRPPIPSAPLTARWDPDAALRMAVIIGDHLLRLAIRDHRQIGWMHLKLATDLRWYPQAVGCDLYDGLSGIGLFLLELGRRVGEQRFLDVAMEIVTTLRYRAGLPAEHERPLGAFEGTAGDLYFLGRFYLGTSDAVALALLQDKAAHLSENIGDGPDCDVIAGAAGALLVLSALRDVVPCLSLFGTAQLLASRLLELAVAENDMLSWNGTGDAACVRLTGLGHGASGIALAFAEFHRWAKEARWRVATDAALRFERSRFDEATLTWPDQRPNRHGEAFTAWCHGGAGIGMVRARLLDLGIADADTARELRHALAMTRKHGFGADRCLCHGDFGNIELWLLAADSTAEARQMLPALAARLLHQLERDWNDCIRAVHQPGLLNGLAGWGYQLLRLAAPHRIPSVLTLQSLTPAGGLQ